MTLDTWVLLGVALALLLDSLLTTLASRDMRERERASREQVRKAMDSWERDRTIVIASLRRLERTTGALLERFEISRTEKRKTLDPYGYIPLMPGVIDNPTHVHQRRNDPMPSSVNGKYHPEEEPSVMLGDMDRPASWRDVIRMREERERQLADHIDKLVEPFYKAEGQA